jgi:N4-gp56 family major capsid protein
MATTGTAALSNQIITQYIKEYLIASQSKVYWDQFAMPMVQPAGQPGRTYTFTVSENLNPTTNTLNELEEVVSQQLSSSNFDVTLYEWGSAIEITKLLAETSQIDVYKQAAEMNGYQMAETVDLISRAVAGQGSKRLFINNRTARNLMAGKSTAADRMSSQALDLWSMFAKNSRMPLYEDNTVCSVMHPFCYYDLMQDSTLRNLSQYGDQSMLFNGEVAYWNGIRWVVAQDAKAFYGAGAAPASAVATSLAAATVGGASSFTVADASNITVGQWLNIGTAETGNTWYDTNELFYVTGINGTTITGFAFEPGPGSSGGLRYAHASGTAVTNNNSVYPMVFLGPESIVKVYSDATGPLGETVVTGPFDKLQRFLTFGWYLIAGWNRAREAWLFRGECGSSQA